MLKQVYILLYILLANTNSLLSQINLVVNGGFETFSDCPASLLLSTDEVSFAQGWKRPNKGRSNYYNTCSPISSGVSVPYNWASFQLPNSGNAYTGFTTFLNPLLFTDGDLFRGYVQTELTKTLKPGREYSIEFWVNRADSNGLGFAVNNIGAFVSATSITKNDSTFFNFVPQVKSSGFISDRVNWTKIAGKFIAAGNEKYLTIGRFGPNNPNEIQNVNGSTAQQSYYFLDDVSLIDSCNNLDFASSNILGLDSTFCVYNAFSKIINAANSETRNYIWSTGATTSSIQITDTGTYWVKMSNGNCFNYDTIKFTSNINPKVDLGPDTAVCFGKRIRLKPKVQKDYYQYTWQVVNNGIPFDISSQPFFDINYTERILLKITEINCVNYDTILVRSSNLGSLRLGNDSTICRKQQFSIGALATSATKYTWNTGSTSPFIIPIKTDNYILTASDGLCNISDTISISVKGPVAPILDTLFCESNPVILYADSFATSIFWNTGSINPFIEVKTTGLYILTQQKDGCVVKDSIQVIADKVPELNLGNDTNVCLTNFFELNAFSPYATKYLWTNGKTTPSIYVEKSGIFEIIASNRSCENRDTIIVNIQNNKPFSFGNDKSDCFENGIVLITNPSVVNSYEWSTGSLDSFIVIKQPGIYWLKTKLGFCINSDSIEFTAKPKPIVNIGNDTVVCRGSSVILDAKNTGSVYEWNTKERTQSVTLKEDGLYTVKVTNSEGCTTIDSLTITHFSEPKLFNNSIQKLCENTNGIELKSDSLFSSYTWSNGDTNSSIFVGNSGNYWLNIITDSGCLVSDTIDVKLIPKPIIDIEKTMRVCELNFIIEPKLINNEGYTYLWQNISDSATFTVTNFGSITLTVTDSNNCSENTIINIINNCPSAVSVPNVFSPNNDGTNDELLPNYENIVRTTFTIFNRWGTTVFTTDNITTSWKGLDNDGNEVAEGIYFYTLKCIGTDAKATEIRGTITLIR